MRYGQSMRTSIVQLKCVHHPPGTSTRLKPFGGFSFGGCVLSQCGLAQSLDVRTGPAPIMGILMHVSEGSAVRAEYNAHMGIILPLRELCPSF
jgi:hypothetical protein